MLTESSKDRFWTKVDVRSYDECWNWMGYRKPNGYGHIGRDYKFWPAHRLAYWLANGGFDTSKHVLHKCDNPPCCNPNHLFLGTNYDNRMDAVAKRRHIHLNTHPMAKINLDKANQIREMYAGGGWTMKALAKQFGVSTMIVSRTVNYKLWNPDP